MRVAYRRIIFLGGAALFCVFILTRSLISGEPTIPIRMGFQPDSSYGTLPLRFEVNQGQAEPSVLFLSRTHGQGIFLKENEIEFHLSRPGRSLKAKASSGGKNRSESLRIIRLQLTFPGSQKGGSIQAEDLQPSQSHYLWGDNPQKWLTGIPHFSRIRRSSLYPGIDLLCYGNPGEFEFDFLVAPTADAESIRFKYEGLAGAKSGFPLRLDPHGDLLLDSAAGLLRQKKPEAYQEVEGRRRPVEAAYRLLEDSTIGFQLGPFDHSLPLVIDPALSYTAVGVGGYAVAADSSGNAVVAGLADPAFPVTPGAFQPSHGGGACMIGPNVVPCADILVAKLNASGTELLYATFLGGSGSDYAYGLAIDGSGEIYLTGATSSANFPTTSGAYQPKHSGNQCGYGPATYPCVEAFAVKLNSTGTQLVYSTYLHGTTGGVGGNGIAVDASGHAYITGDSQDDSFLTKLNPAGSGILYSRNGLGGSAIAIDAQRNAYVTGRKGNSSQVSKVSADGTQVLYSRKLGGSTPSYSAPIQEIEGLTGIAVDAWGAAYITGYTAYTDYPTTPGVLFPKPVGVGLCGTSICRDALVTKLSPDGTQLLFSTYLGTPSIDAANAIVVDEEGNPWVAGSTTSLSFPTPPGTVAVESGGIFLVKLNATASEILYALSLGNHEAEESANALALDSHGSVYVTGTAGPHFTASTGAYHRPGSGVFVSKLQADASCFIPIVISSSGYFDSFFTSQLTLTNRSHHLAQLEFLYTASFGGGSGRGVDTLEAHRQKIIPDAIAYLRSLKIPIPESGNVGGTLRIRFGGVSSPGEVAALVRTTTALPNGRAGLAYHGVANGLINDVYLSGLVQNLHNRSNLAIQNAGSAAQGPITFRLTVFSGDPASSIPPQVYEESLAPGGFKQFTGILWYGKYLLSNGYVKVERVQGTAPFYAYAVINDQITSDGSFIPPAPAKTEGTPRGLILPAVVETAAFSSEVVLTNWSDKSKLVQFQLKSDGIAAPDSTLHVALSIQAGEQLIIPDFVRWLRQRWLPGIWFPEAVVASPLILTCADGDISGLFLGVRTSTLSSDGGKFGVFYPAIPFGHTLRGETWLTAIQQNEENRTNLGIVNTGEDDQSDSEFQIEIFDGTSGTLAATLASFRVEARRMRQIDSILKNFAPGLTQAYLRISQLKGNNPFWVYAIINDGKAPGERTGDGSYIAGAE